jgi:hypothetical protein
MLVEEIMNMQRAFDKFYDEAQEFIKNYKQREKELEKIRAKRTKGK